MAYVILKTGGKQYKVAEGDLIDVEKLDAASGPGNRPSPRSFSTPTATSTPTARRTSAARRVVGEVVEQRKAPKVIAFKYRRRKGYHRTVGHRQKLTRVRIKSISL